MTTLDEASLQLADSLAIDAVPAKLRCASCNKIAVNAVKLACCDQSICEVCLQDLPETCPICSHSPLSKDAVTLDKKTRMSVKAFLKGELEKRRKKNIDTSAAQAAELATQVSAPSATPGPAAAAVADTEVSADAANATDDGEKDVDGVPDAVALPDDATATIEEPQDGSAAAGGSAEGDQEQEEEEDDDDDVVITTERPEQEMQEQAAQEEQETQQQVGYEQQQNSAQMNGQKGFGFGQGQQQGGFGNMDFNTMNNFNPMMAMQNGMGMPNFGMGMPSMMGMPAMNMDPSMMFNGGFGGMNGMNDMSAMMNMGMGMNGMGAFGGGMPGMGMNNGPNFFPAQGGFNQSSFGNQVNQNFHHNRGYGSRPYNRGFGRGRGFYNRGRGGWQNYGQHQGQNPNFVSQQTHQQQQQQNFQNNDESFDASAQSGARRGSPSYEPSKAADEDANGGNLQPRQTDSELPDATNTAEADTTNNVITDSTEVQENREDSTTTPRPLGDQGTEDVATNFENVDAAGEPMDMADGAGGADTDAPREAMQNDSTTTTQDNAFAGQPHQEAYGYGARGRGGFRGGRGGLRGNVGAYGSVIALGEPDPMPAPPVNAPTGPKAMREGKPNSGWYSRPAQASAPVASPTAVETSKPPQPEDRGRSKSRSRSRSRHRSRKERRGSRDGDAESDEEYASRRDRKRRERKERERRRDGDGEEVKGDESSKKGRSRSESVEETSRHRHRDKDDDRYASRSHRAKSRDRRGRHHRSRSPAKDDLEVNGDGFDNSRYRSKKDRRHEEDYELDRSKTKDRSRKSSRRDNDYHEHKHHSHDTSRHGRSARDEGSRERQKHKPVLEEPQDEIGFKIKGSKSAALKAGLDTSMAPPTTFGRDRNSRRTSMQDFAPATPSTPASGDPYADERLKRQRDREQKHEDRRRQSMHSLGKRQSRDEDEEVPTGPKRDGDRGRGGKRSRKDGRRFSAKYEGEIGDAYEERDERRWR